MNAVLKATHQLTPDIRQYWFMPEKPLRFTAGQFLDVTLPHDNTDDRGDTRWFTICSSPDDELFCITTRHDYDHGSSFKNALLQMEHGYPLQISEPLGDFVLPKDPARPVIFVAAGIGITPFVSILESLAGESRDIKLIHAVADESDIIFQDVFEEAGVHATIIVKNASPEWGGERGLVDAAKVIGIEQPSPDSLIYISGPEAMVEQLKSELIEKGVGDNQVITDTFPGYTSL